MPAGRKAENGSLPDYRLPKRERLRLQSDFSRLRKHGNRRTSRHLVVLFETTTERRSFGVAVGRRVGKAVERSLVRRRIRESYRKHRKHISPALLLFIARPSSTDVSQRELDREFCVLLQGAGLWKEHRCGE